MVRDYLSDNNNRMRNRRLSHLADFTIESGESN